MSLPFLARWLQSLAAQRVREAVVEAAREHVEDQARRAAEPPPPCDVGVVFATVTESGGLEDLLKDLVTIRGRSFSIRQGRIGDRGLALAVSGMGAAAAARATEALIAGHRPRWLISSGFCGGLSDRLARYDVVIANELVNPQGGRIACAAPAVEGQSPLADGVHVGRLLTVEGVVTAPERKRALGVEYAALAADMESYAVAEVARTHGIPLLAVRIVLDPVDERLPKEIARLARKQSLAGQVGTLLGALVDRPASVKQILALQQRSLAATDRLAQFLVQLTQGL